LNNGRVGWVATPSYPYSKQIVYIKGEPPWQSWQVSHIFNDSYIKINLEAIKNV